MDGGFWNSLWNLLMPPDPPLSDFVIIEDDTRRTRAEESMKSIRYWRFKVSIMILVLVAFVMWSASPWGYVFAADVKEKIETAISPLNARLEKLEKASASSATALNELVANGIATDICRIVIRQRKEVDSSEHGALRLDKDEKQRRYRSLIGEYYPEERCGS